MVKIFQKKAKKTPFFGLFFQNFASGAEILAKTGTKQCFGRARKFNFIKKDEVRIEPISQQLLIEDIAVPIFKEINEIFVLVLVVLFSSDKLLN